MLWYIEYVDGCRRYFKKRSYKSEVLAPDAETDLRLWKRVKRVWNGAICDNRMDPPSKTNLDGLVSRIDNVVTMMQFQPQLQRIENAIAKLQEQQQQQQQQQSQSDPANPESEPDPPSEDEADPTELTNYSIDPDVIPRELTMPVGDPIDDTDTIEIEKPPITDIPPVVAPEPIENQTPEPSSSPLLPAAGLALGLGGLTAAVSSISAAPVVAAAPAVISAAPAVVAASAAALSGPAMIGLGLGVGTIAAGLIVASKLPFKDALNAAYARVKDVVYPDTAPILPTVAVPLPVPVVDPPTHSKVDVNQTPIEIVTNQVEDQLSTQVPEDAPPQAQDIKEELGILIQEQLVANADQHMVDEIEKQKQVLQDKLDAVLAESRTLHERLGDTNIERSKCDEKLVELEERRSECDVKVDKLEEQIKTDKHLIIQSIKQFVQHVGGDEDHIKKLNELEKSVEDPSMTSSNIVKTLTDFWIDAAKPAPNPTETRQPVFEFHELTYGGDEHHTAQFVKVTRFVDGNHEIHTLLYKDERQYMRYIYFDGEPIDYSLELYWSFVADPSMMFWESHTQPKAIIGMIPVIPTLLTTQTLSENEKDFWDAYTWFIGDLLINSTRAECLFLNLWRSATVGNARFCFQVGNKLTFRDNTQLYVYDEKANNWTGWSGGSIKFHPVLIEVTDFDHVVELKNVT